MNATCARTQTKTHTLQHINRLRNKYNTHATVDVLSSPLAPFMNQYFVHTDIIMVEEFTRLSQLCVLCKPCSDVIHY